MVCIKIDSKFNNKEGRSSMLECAATNNVLIVFIIVIAILVWEQVLRWQTILACQRVVALRNVHRKLWLIHIRHGRGFCKLLLEDLRWRPVEVRWTSPVEPVRMEFQFLIVKCGDPHPAFFGLGCRFVIEKVHIKLTRAHLLVWVRLVHSCDALDRVYVWR